jgi:long-chain acyl-CoA synthetase
MDPATLVDLFTQGLEASSRPDRFLRKVRGTWQPVSTGEFARDVRACAGALASIGVGRGDRVAILSYNRVEWAAADYACHLLGAASVPLYSTLPEDQVGVILADCGAKAAFVENETQKDKVRGRVPHVICFQETPGFPSFSEFLKKGSAPDPVPVGPDDLATLIYTSGTTGTPKGVMLTHWNIVSNILSAIRYFSIDANDTILSFLPLSHGFERLFDYAFFWKGACIAYAEQVEKVAENLTEVRPTFMAAVPRFYEKLHSRIRDAAGKMGRLRRSTFEWARAAGAREAEYRRRGERPPLLTRWRHALARSLVLDRIAESTGGRMRYFVSGGAPLPADVSEYLFSLGLTICEGYGLTETAPVLTVNPPGAIRPGTVGKPLPGVELRIAPDGEILARGPNVMKGYWNRPSDTQEAFQDGWFRTGDIGEIDAEGYLRITDRKKDLIKTAGGKYIAPQPIENRLKASPLILNAVVVGESRKFPAALIVPAPRATPEQIQAEVDAVNRTLAHHEQLKKFAILERDFSIEEGELTPTLKVRRRQIEKKYRDRIQALYPDERP